MNTRHRVVLQPTQGGYQKELSGVIVSESAKQITVKVDGKLKPIRFHKSSGMPVNKIDQQFPCYRVILE